eukprot:scaffold281_cov353-Pinguiococcus_pyrenoidosus.AAC.2
MKRLPPLSTMVRAQSDASTWLHSTFCKGGQLKVAAKASGICLLAFPCQDVLGPPTLAAHLDTISSTTEETSSMIADCRADMTAEVKREGGGEKDRDKKPRETKRKERTRSCPGLQKPCKRTLGQKAAGRATPCNGRGQRLEKGRVPHLRDPRARRAARSEGVVCSQDVTADGMAVLQIWVWATPRSKAFQVQIQYARLQAVAVALHQAFHLLLSTTEGQEALSKCPADDREAIVKQATFVAASYHVASMARAVRRPSAPCELLERASCCSALGSRPSLQDSPPVPSRKWWSLPCELRGVRGI